MRPERVGSSGVPAVDIWVIDESLFKWCHARENATSLFELYIVGRLQKRWWSIFCAGCVMLGDDDGDKIGDEILE